MARERDEDEGRGKRNWVRGRESVNERENLRVCVYVAEMADKEKGRRERETERGGDGEIEM
jgi:hypothetical protein